MCIELGIVKVYVKVSLLVFICKSSNKFMCVFLFDHVMELSLSSDHKDFWASPVEIIVFASSTSFMFTSLGFPLSKWGKKITFFSLLCVLNLVL